MKILLGIIVVELWLIGDILQDINHAIRGDKE